MCSIMAALVSKLRKHGSALMWSILITWLRQLGEFRVTLWSKYRHYFVWVCELLNFEFESNDEPPNNNIA